MDFGKVEPEQIASVDFTLPPDTALNKTTFKAASKKFDLNAYIVCAKVWSERMGWFNLS